MWWDQDARGGMRESRWGTRGALIKMAPVRCPGLPEGRLDSGLLATNRKAASSLRAPSAQALPVSGTSVAWPDALRAAVVCVPTTVRSAVRGIRCHAVHRGWEELGIGHESVRHRREGSGCDWLR